MKLLTTQIFCLILIQINLTAQWDQLTFPTSEDLFMVRFVSETSGWVVGENFVYKTTDGGINWETQDSISGGGCEALYAINALTAIYSDYGSGGIRRTTDGGITWYTADDLDCNYFDFKFLNQNLGFACGSTNSYDSLVVRRTTDGGENWNTITSIFAAGNYDFEGISFIDSLHGWAVTYTGWIYYSSNGGFNWSFQDSVGYYNSSLRVFIPCRDIQFTSPDSGWVVGGIAGETLVATTTDGGESWLKKSLQGISSCSIREIEMINSQVGWFAGANNGGATIAITSDGGNTWINQSQFQPGFNSISMVNENVGYAVGNNGTIYKTINGGVTFNDENNSDMAENFTLSQNYPNPFNPSTTINYQVPVTSFVTLKIYDVLGTEVATLVNEEKPAGEYENEFIGNNLSSGIYFYQLKAEAFVETKKMILLK